MIDHEQLQKELRGCSVVLEIHSVSHLTTHNCYLINDTFLLSYGQAQNIHKRSKSAQTMAGVFSNFAERVVGWTLQAIYRCCFASQAPIKMEKSSAETLPTDD